MASPELDGPEVNDEQWKIYPMADASHDTDILNSIFG
jgi:hypothetical protein